MVRRNNLLSRAEQSRAEQSRAEQNSQQRIDWIDAVRGIGILLVVLGHTDPPVIKTFIYGFHMPLFFILSGYLYNRKNTENAIGYEGKLLKRYIVPYFILCLINLILVFVFHVIGVFEDFNLTKYLIGIVWSHGEVEWMPNCSPLWFLTALFCAMTMFNFIQKVKEKWIRGMLLIVCLAAGIIADILDLNKFIWNIDTAFMAVVLIWIGYMIREYKLIEKIRNNVQAIVVSVVLLIVGTACIYLNPQSVVSFDLVGYGNPALMLIGAVSVSTVLMLAVSMWYRNGRIWNGIKFLGRHTIFIMGFDYFSNTIAVSILGKIGLRIWGTVFCGKVVVLLIGLFIWMRAISLIPNKKIQAVLSF